VNETHRAGDARGPSRSGGTAMLIALAARPQASVLPGRHAGRRLGVTACPWAWRCWAFPCRVFRHRTAPDPGIRDPPALASRPANWVERFPGGNLVLPSVGPRPAVPRPTIARHRALSAPPSRRWASPFNPPPRAPRGCPSRTIVLRPRACGPHAHAAGLFPRTCAGRRSHGLDRDRNRSFGPAPASGAFFVTGALNRDYTLVTGITVLLWARSSS